MLSKIDEFAKETEKIIKYFLFELRYEVNQTKDATQVAKQIPEGTSLPEIIVEIFGSQNDQPSIALVVQEVGKDAPTENLVADIFSEATQDPPKIEVTIEMIVEEIAKVEKSVSVEVEKDKSDEPTEKPLVAMIVANVSNKGKHIDVEDDFSHGLVDLRTLSPIQALKLATQAQIKESKDLLKSQSKDKEVISFTIEVLEKLLPSFSQDSGASPSRKLKNMLSVVNTHFVSLEKATDESVQKIFNEMRLQNKLKEVERDGASLKAAIKSIEEALDEGGKIFKSCLALPNFIAEID